MEREIQVAEVDWKARCSPGPIGPALDDEIHVWRMSLLGSDVATARFEKSLSDDERARAARFVFGRDKRRFVIGRGVVRSILGGYLGIQAERVEFVYGTEGKPRLTESPSGPKLSFNVTHCEDLALCVVFGGEELGVDLERVDTEVEVQEIAELFFTTAEVSAIDAMPPKLRHVRFFELWTGKEAYVKALGHGLSVPLNEFDMAEVSAEREVKFNGPSGAWWLRRFVPAPGYVAALMTKSRAWRVSWFDWKDPGY